MTIHFIGDPHLGRKFETGVPQHRRGERETKQMSHFAAELETEADDIVMVGDLFDNPHVSQAVIVAAARIALGAAERHPETRYWMMAGNHDLPRNLGVTGAWTAFRKMIDDRLPNISTVNRALVTPSGIALFPWDWDLTAAQQVADAGRDAHVLVHTAVGHWDLQLWEGKDDHLAPTVQLCHAFGENVRIVSGHYHVAGPYVVNGITVDCTGSMEPYTHGEDPEGEMYVTMTKAELEAYMPEQLRNKYVRILLDPGEEMPEIDCLGLTAKRVGGAIDAEQDTLSIDDFDWDVILAGAVKEMDPVVQIFVKERMHVSEEQR